MAEMPLRPLPVHISIIMDGNGRWAAARHLPRQAGHSAGIDAVRKSVRAASDMGIRYLTLFGFSSENWKRPRVEVDYLMDLMRIFIRRELNDLNANNIRLTFIGDRVALPSDILKLIDEAEAKTGANTGLTLRIAFNYGGQQEITAGVERLLAKAAKGEIDIATAGEDDLTELLWSKGTPDPELIIRTSGEQRLSNFLLWQASRAELAFVEKWWPDFNGSDIRSAVDAYRAGRKVTALA